MRLTPKQIGVLLCPIVLIATTASIGLFATQHLSLSSAYLSCFVFYWLVWCYGLPIAVLSNEELKELCTWRLPRPKWLAVLFILMPFGGTVAEVFIPEIGNLTAMLIIVTLISAIMNGPGEELL